MTQHDQPLSFYPFFAQNPHTTIKPSVQEIMQTYKNVIGAAKGIIEVSPFSGNKDWAFSKEPNGSIYQVIRRFSETISIDEPTNDFFAWLSEFSEMTRSNEQIWAEIVIKRYDSDDHELSDPCLILTYKLANGKVSLIRPYKSKGEFKFNFSPKKE